MHYDHRITGQVIGLLRTRRKMTQETLSGLVGIARSHLAMIETGRRNPDVNTLWRIASALGMPLSDLFRLVEEETERCTPTPHRRN